MDTLKYLFIVLFFSINSFCHAIQIECSICHEEFTRTKGTSGTACPACKELIAAVKAWKQGCPGCRQYSLLDLCPDCLIEIKPEPTGCNERHHKLYNVCVECLKVACTSKYDSEETPNCLITNCKKSIDPKGCCGYPTGLCTEHNKSLLNAIKTHKENCKASCKYYPLLDLCPECLESINKQKDNEETGHKDCIWKDTPYDVYVPCETCLACYACE